MVRGRYTDICLEKLSVNFEHFFSRSPDEARKKPFDSKSVYNVDTDVDVDTDADVDVEKMKQKS